MTGENEEQSDALRSAAAKRGELKEALSLVEVAAAAPTGDSGWRAKLLGELEDLRVALSRHVEEVEAPDGLLAEMTIQAPRLANQIADVRDEHPELCRQVLQTITNVKTGSGVDELRTEILEMLAALARHRQKGADLVYEGYSVDIGGS